MPQYNQNQLSPFDLEAYQTIRGNVSNFLKIQSEKLDSEEKMILDIAPQDHEGANKYFIKSTVQTLDIDQKADTTYHADITKNNHEIIPDNTFDVIVCTEVLEHTNNPFLAASEMKRILKKGGIILLSVPFNFRIHGPLPDNWRISEHGLRSIFIEFDSDRKSVV